MPTKTTTIEGEEKVARAFDELADRAEDVRAVNEQLGEIGVDAAQRAAPKRTGELVESISAEVGDEAGELVATAGHAPFVEFGTIYMPATPFLVAGYNAMRERAEPIAEAWMQAQLDAVDRMA